MFQTNLPHVSPYTMNNKMSRTVLIFGEFTIYLRNQTETLWGEILDFDTLKFTL